MSLIRCFIAISLSFEIRDSLESLLIQLKSSKAGNIRWIPSENIHLTLKFLGEISPENLNTVKNILLDEINHTQPFEISISKLGAFPNISRPRVIWIGVQAPDTLFQLQKQIDDRTKAIGILSDTRSFSPHLTLGRVNRYCTVDQTKVITALLKQTNYPDDLGSMHIEAIHLYKSELTRSGAVYSCLAEKKL